MPTYVTGNIWDGMQYVKWADLLLFPANGVVLNERLVMGAGFAKDVKLKFPEIDAMFGERILDGTFRFEKNAFLYGLLICEHEDGWKVGAFQSKLHWQDKSNLNAIKAASDYLAEWCEMFPNTSVHLPFPGIGFGGLHPEIVKPFLDQLPTQVTIWQKE